MCVNTFDETAPPIDLPRLSGRYQRSEEGTVMTDTTEATDADKPAADGLPRKVPNWVFDVLTYCGLSEYSKGLDDKEYAAKIYAQKLRVMEQADYTSFYWDVSSIDAATSLVCVLTRGNNYAQVEAQYLGEGRVRLVFTAPGPRAPLPSRDYL